MVPLISLFHIAKLNKLMLAVSLVIGEIAVTTTVLPLPAKFIASPIISPCKTPGVMMTRSAIWPYVISMTDIIASAIDGNVCVAPNSMAFSRLNSTGSMAMMRFAPAIRAPCTAFIPMPPIPTTTTVSPGCVPARFAADPQPVATPHDTSATHSSGMSFSTLMIDCSLTHANSENVPTLAINVMG